MIQNKFSILIIEEHKFNQFSNFNKNVLCLVGHDQEVGQYNTN